MRERTNKNIKKELRKKKMKTGRKRTLKSEKGRRRGKNVKGKVRYKKSKV